MTIAEQVRELCIAEINQLAHNQQAGSQREKAELLYAVADRFRALDLSQYEPKVPEDVQKQTRKECKETLRMVMDSCDLDQARDLARDTWLVLNAIDAATDKPPPDDGEPSSQK